MLDANLLYWRYAIMPWHYAQCFTQLILLKSCWHIYIYKTPYTFVLHSYLSAMAPPKYVNYFKVQEDHDFFLLTFVNVHNSAN